jgi:hypothetical protein
VAFSRYCVPLALIVVALPAACGNPSEPSPFKSGPPANITGTWLATVYLVECQDWKWAACNASGVQQNRQSQRLLRLQQSDDGRVDAMLFHGLNPAFSSHTPLSGTYRDGVLHLTYERRLDQCGSVYTQVWSNTFLPMRGRWVSDDPGCPPPNGLSHRTYEIRGMVLQN